MDNMNDLDANIATLQYFARQEIRVRGELSGLSSSGLPPAFQEEQRAVFEQDIQGMRVRFKTLLEKVENFPSRHIRHKNKLDEFWQDGSYEDSVFIMTKFPESDTDEDNQLRAVLTAIRQAVQARGYTPRLASDKRYHPQLWDNVELYLLGCASGVAVVEDRYKEELNPNVAKEWGWMRGMGRDVLFLLEENFEHLRADWGGLLTDVFSWDDPASQITTAINNWLPHRP